MWRVHACLPAACMPAHCKPAADLAGWLTKADHVPLYLLCPAQQADVPTCTRTCPSAAARLAVCSLVAGGLRRAAMQAAKECAVQLGLPWTLLDGESAAETRRAVRPRRAWGQAGE